MKRSFSNHLVLGVLLGCAGAGHAATPTVNGTGSEFKITARVYNYAKIPESALERAKRQAWRVLERAGVSTTWVDCAVSPKEANREPACSTPPGASNLVLKLLPQEMAKRFDKRPGTFGFAVPVSNVEWLGTAFVFVEEAHRLAYYGSFSTNFETNHAVVLGHLMAHEIGHLLLGPGSHARSGIMSFPWSKSVLKRLGTAHLAFTNQEAELIQERLHAAHDPARLEVVARSRSN